MTKEAFRAEFWTLVEAAPRVVITAHFSPDDDSIGSVLSMREIIVQKFPQKNTLIIYGGVMTDRWKAIKNFETVQFVDDVANYIEPDDLLVVLDVSQYARFSAFPEKIATHTKKVVIDHHKSVPDDFLYALIDPVFSSNSELLHSIFKSDSVLTKELAEPLLLGILGDTGNFSFVSPGQTAVFEVAKDLIDTLGVSIDAFRSGYGGIPMHILPLIQNLYKNIRCMEVEGWPQFDYSFIERSVIEEGGFTNEDISAAAAIFIGQILTRLHGYSWGFVVTPRTDNTFRMSSRSLPGSVNVRLLHEALGIGSGHDRAAGGKFEEASVEMCIQNVFDWMKNNAPVLG